MGKCIFVTGTGTDIGKTYVSGLIVKKLRDEGKNAGYYKAAVSGADTDENGNTLPGDVLHVLKTAGLDESPAACVSYVYKEAVSPHLAARMNNRPIEFQKIERDFRRARDAYDFLTVEGSGGIICPLRWDETEHLIIDDMVKRLGLATLVVAPAGLGTINAAVLTIEHLKMRRIPVKGVIFNFWHPDSIMEQDNADMIEAITGVPVVAKVRQNDTVLDMAAESLAALYE